jgi:dihydroneopterin triphosphate diphosphatase
VQHSVYDSCPEGFRAQYDVLGCYLVVKDKILLLKRARGDQKGKWCIPAGRKELGESLEEALFREIKEETSICLQSPQYFDKLFIVFNEIYYVFYMYIEKLATQPEVILNSEHTEFQWVSPQEALMLPLIAGGREAVQLFISRSQGEYV